MMGGFFYSQNNSMTVILTLAVCGGSGSAISATISRLVTIGIFAYVFSYKIFRIIQIEIDKTRWKLSSKVEQ
ncbi:hypothetical protein BP422_21910 [Brevibacillus formosus]|uniref:Uncharacterized protein n=1 Tax=Brevibacillus formosus TaxID=54913 RepID=A0A220MMI0_9BACL|nr:hypothetical protein BP422_21910 [Brevibacillus formosus]